MNGALRPKYRSPGIPKCSKIMENLNYIFLNKLFAILLTAGML